MFQNVSNMSPQDLEFLKRNFLVYQYETNTYHSDFSQVFGKQIIFLGETHYIKKILEKQARLIPILAGVRQTVVFLEGSPLGKSTSRPYFNDFPPSIKLFGADVRVNDHDENQDRLQAHLIWQTACLWEDKRKRKKISDAKIAGLLNENLGKNAWVVGNKLIVSPQVHEQLQQIPGYEDLGPPSPSEPSTPNSLESPLCTPGAQREAQEGSRLGI